MKKSKRRFPGKAIFLIIVILVIALILKFGSGWFGGGGGGSGSSDNSNDNKTAEEKKDEPKNDEIEKIRIEVKQDKYLLDGMEVTLDEIKEKIKATTKKVAVILENNYASAKIWDDIKNALSELGITVVEE